MSDPFADVFDELIDEDEELQKVHDELSYLLPEAHFAVARDDGSLYGELADDILAAHLSSRRDQLVEEKIESFPLAESFAYCTKLPVDIYIVFTLPAEAADITSQPQLHAMYRNSLGLFAAGRRHEELRIEKEQAVRQIEVLTSRHTTLLNDNHDQFLLIQKKEKEYAATLESEIARQTKEVRAKNEELKKASKLKSEFLANMSHELRTPMNAIIGFSGLLLESDLNDEQQDFAKTIATAGDSLLVLINDILDLAKIEAGKLELSLAPFISRDLVGEVQNILKAQAQSKGNTLNVEVEKGVPVQMMGDDVRLRQILINLTGNALKFTENGTVTIRARMGGRDGSLQGDMVTFQVQDSGIGIPANRLDAIFEKFTQADGSTTRKFGGTGLGLSICVQLVDIMGGDIWVESEEGEGSTFSFTVSLPEVAGDVVEDKAKEEASSTAQAREITVLLAEDNLVNQKLASLLVKRQGCKVEVAGNGLEALEKLKTDIFDLILMDIQMPEMDGHEATTRIREIEESDESNKYASLKDRSSRIPIVGLTAHARKEDEDRCYAVGMDAFLTKPINKDKFAATLAQFR